MDDDQCLQAEEPLSMAPMFQPDDIQYLYLGPPEDEICFFKWRE